LNYRENVAVLGLGTVGALAHARAALLQLECINKRIHKLGRVIGSLLAYQGAGEGLVAVCAGNK